MKNLLITITIMLCSMFAFSQTETAQLITNSQPTFEADLPTTQHQHPLDHIRDNYFGYEGWSSLHSWYPDSTDSITTLVETDSCVIANVNINENYRTKMFFTDSLMYKYIIIDARYTIEFFTELYGDYIINGDNLIWERSNIRASFNTKAKELLIELI